MESIEEQRDPPSPPNILSSVWTNIADTKKAVKTWLLDQAALLKDIDALY